MCTFLLILVLNLRHHRKGILNENIKAGTPDEEFRTRLLQALRLGKIPEVTDGPSNHTNGDQQAEPQDGPSSSANVPREQSQKEQLSERSSKLKGKQKANPKPAAQSSDPRHGQDSGDPNPRDASKRQRETWVQEQKKRKEEAQLERKRILAQIENDKQERKQREQARKAAAAAVAAEAENVDDDQASTSPAAGVLLKARYANECVLKVRTFDGSTVAGKFPSEQSLREHVRAWIESEIGRPDAPYEFTQVLAPAPNRRISVAEEEESLYSLGLSPSATLVMVPVKSYTDAYATGSQGYISSGLSYGYGMVKGGFSMVGQLAGALVGSNNQDNATEANAGRPQTVDGAAESPRSSINVRMLRDEARPKDDQQLYNGNTLNFEPRPKDDEKED